MLDIRPFTSDNIPDALRLCAQANWNHVAADWQRIIDLLPEACLGGFDGNVMRSTCTLTQFGKQGWVGTFLVDERLRGTGEGKAICRATLNKAEALGIETLGIDSSDLGRPIYSKNGFFLTDQGIELWTGVAPEAGPADPSVVALRPAPAHWGSLLSLDRHSVAVDRGRQLRHLADEQGASCRLLMEDGQVAGFGFVRPGKMTGAIGPVVAKDLARAQKVVQALFADHRANHGDKPVGLALLDQPEFKNWLTSQGLQMRRRNIRMFRPAYRQMLSGSNVFAATGLGMG
jgi:hypothetical protein